MTRLMKILLLSSAIISSAGFAVWEGSRVSAAISGETQEASPRGGRGGARGAGGGSRIETFDVAVAEISTLEPISIAYGRITAPRRVEIEASVAGDVVFVMDGLRDGVVVEAGDVLFSIDDTDTAIALKEAEIALRSAGVALEDSQRRVFELQEEMILLEEKLAIAQSELERTEPLVERGIASIATLEAVRSSHLSTRQTLATQKASIRSAQNDVAQNEISVEQAGLAIERVKKSLADHKVVASITGEISGQMPLVGQAISAASIGEIVDLTALEARLELSQAALSRITGEDGRAKALKVDIRRPSGNVQATAYLDRLAIEASTDSTESSIAIATLSADQGALLRPGDFVEARIQEGALDEVVSLPATAVSAEERVIFVDEAGSAVFDQVKIVRHLGDTVFVEGDIAGRTFVVSPDAEISEGQQVVSLEGEETRARGKRPAQDSAGIAGADRSRKGSPDSKVLVSRRGDADAPAREGN